MTENFIHKNGIYDFNITTEEDKPLQKAVFYTQDTGGTARLIFNIDKDNQDLGLSSAAELELAMILSSGEESESKYLVKPTVTDGVRGNAEYVLTDSQISHSGSAIAELYIKYKNSQAMRVYKFSFEIKKALIDSDFFPVKEYYVERWDDYEKIFDESIEKLNTKLDDVDKKADDLQQQFDNLDPTQFLPKSGGTMTGALQFDGVPTIFQAKQNNAWWYRLTSENSTTYQQSLYPTIVSGINGVLGAGYNFKQAYLRLNNIDLETVAGSQAKAAKALDDAKTDASAKVVQALVDSKAYTDSKITQTVWTGSFYMIASQTVTPSIPLSQCKAWIIYWSKYSAGAARDYYWCTQVVTKETYGGHNFDAMMDNSPVHKYLYVSATQLTGSDDNSTGTNNQAVMRKVVALL
ncbi:BppU family phage baseplate upper protein [Listeria seeligeri]|uniref:BppU family phage baseplate upper protein n=1 Tax=Listeria seeligeri TaxID=1640 RepID=UPI0022EAACE9|nr:BppU family phage baseplate upper protein [Listeria seeligeri]